MFEYLHALVGGNIKNAKFRDTKLLKYFGSKVIFRFFHSKGNSVDFKFTMNGSSADLSITDSKKADGYRCISFYLDDILNFEEHTPLKRIVALSSRYDIARANKTKKPIIFLKLALNRNFIATLYHLTIFLTKTIIRSIFQNPRR
jgi:hypothetical protein